MNLSSTLVRRCAAALFALAFALAFVPASALAQTAYKLPPKPVADVIDASPTPSAMLSPRGDAMLLIETKPNPSIAILAEPILRLGGVRISPRLNASQRSSEVNGFVVQFIPPAASAPAAAPASAAVRSVRIQVPDGSRLGSPQWSHDGSKIAFTRDAANGVELWIADPNTGKAQAVKQLMVNDILAAPFQWLDDNQSLLVNAIPQQRGAAPAPRTIPTGPAVEETAGKQAQVRTYQDLLQNSNDEAMFEFYTTTQLELVRLGTGFATGSSGATGAANFATRTPLGAPAIYTDAEFSPNGQYLLVTRLLKPFSYRVTANEFAKSIELWGVRKEGKSATMATSMLRQIANLPIEDQTPRQGVPLGVRSIVWQPLQPSTLLWVEALDGGDPMKKAEFRDRLMALVLPPTASTSNADGKELLKLKHRFVGYGWTAVPNQITLSEYDRDRRWRTTSLVTIDATKDATKGESRDQKILFDLSVNDSYNDPGSPVYERRPDGTRVFAQDGDWMYLSGAGASEKGDMPFLDKMNLKTLEKQRLFRSSATSYEQFAGFASVAGVAGGGKRNRIITRFETKTDVPNFYAVELSGAASGATSSAGSAGEQRTQITKFTDPTPQLTTLKKQLVTYKRADGVPLSGTLYLPADYKPGTKLPCVIWAYPLEYNDAATAGQVRSSPNRFTTRSRSYSTVYFALQGYAVLQDATVPVVGSPETANDTFIEQITSGAKAAIDHLDSLGVIDRKRVAVAGHSYGAFMTAHLLAHTDLFAAGLAGSGAYNRTLTPFGFQGERRSYWEAPEVYTKLSPFTAANAIKKPLLLMHGEADNNPGTFPIQSQRLFAAIAGNGGTARLVMLPNESHGYLARESVMHAMAEMIDWADRHVKNLPAK
jgi:dipeptidyl aminopeptidase/acylaminoacyl peptidase